MVVDRRLWGRNLDRYLPSRINIRDVGWERFLDTWDKQALWLVKAIAALEKHPHEYAKGDHEIMGRMIPREMYAGGLGYPGETQQERKDVDERLLTMRTVLQDQFEWLCARGNIRITHEFEILGNEGDAEALRADTLSRKPVSGTEIDRVEKDLEVTLPLSYKEFLKYSNGWITHDEFLLPVRYVKRISDREEWVDFEPDILVYSENCSDVGYFGDDDHGPFSVRKEMIGSALAISDELFGALGIVMLNPKAIHEDGEWEAWLSVGRTGISIFRSFEGLMELLYMQDIAWYREYADKIGVEWKDNDE